MESIGQQLASARRRKGLNLKEVEEATKIRLRFLEALEADDFNVIPGPVYVKGFIRAYASLLKLDHQPLLEQYKMIKPAEELTRVEPVAPFVPVDQKNLKGRRFTIPAALLTIIFLMTVFLAYLGYQDTIQSSKLNDRRYVNRELRELENKRRQKVKKKQKKKAAKKEIFTVKLIVEKGTWVKVKAEDKTFFSNYLRSGTKEVFISRKPLEITTGQGSNVKVYLNGHYKGKISEEPAIATKVYKK